VRDQLGTVTATISVVVPTGRFGPTENASAPRHKSSSLRHFRPTWAGHPDEFHHRLEY
jgi:hypothetical protein